VQNPRQILAAQTLPCDYLLLDAYGGNALGGTGETFDHSLIPALEKPVLLAGGLNAENIGKAAACRPYCLDISSGTETCGFKDAKKVKEIIRIVREEC
jgi:phosphoribosylanthranilate isomerase